MAEGSPSSPKKRSRIEELETQLRSESERAARLNTELTELRYNMWKKRSEPDCQRFITWASKWMDTRDIDYVMRENIERIFFTPEGSDVAMFLMELMWNIERAGIKREEGV